MCDGKHTISQIIKGVQKQYQLTRKEAETSLFTFMQQLGKRNFIQFAIPQQNAPPLSDPEPEKRSLFGFLPETVVERIDRKTARLQLLQRTIRREK